MTDLKPPPDHDYAEDLCDDEEYTDEDAALDDCGLMPDGQCFKAGSEECDFMCPMRDSEHFCGSEAWKRKHARKRVRKARSRA